MKERIYAVQKMIDWIDNHVVDNPSLSEISKEIGYSPWYCSELFHRVIGMTIKGSHNKLIYASMLFSLVTTAAVIFVPFLANAFEFVGVSLVEYIIAIALGALVIPVVEGVKFVQRRMAKEK